MAYLLSLLYYNVYKSWRFVKPFFRRPAAKGRGDVVFLREDGMRQKSIAVRLPEGEH